MSRIILHVGTHKTATTTIQDTLALNRRRLAERGVHYPRIGISNGQHALATQWVPLPRQFQARRPALEAWAALAERHAGGTDTLLLSSEELSRGKPAVDMRELSTLTADFGQRTVICLVRNQISYLQSIYLEVIQKARVADFTDFVQQAMTTGQITGVSVDYNQLYDQLLEGFAPEEIVFLSFEAAVKAPGGVLGALFDKLGYPGLAAGLAPLPGDFNVSAEPLAAWTATKVAAPDLAPPGLVAQAATTLAEIFPGRRSTLYTRAEAREVAAHFGPRNAAFEARVRKVEPAFAMAPLVLSDDLVYRGQLTELKFWIRLAHRLHARA